MKFLKKILNHTYKPLLKEYLSHDRTYFYHDLRLNIKAGVFHPGYFFSTKFLLGEVQNSGVKNKSLLELGCGSGLISLVAAKKGARVTASDIDNNAVACTIENASKNSLNIVALQSDLFEKIPTQPFDLIAINPPYYRGEAKTDAEIAWYCGNDLEYFERLFAQMGKYVHTGSVVLMVLSEDCELKAIEEIAKKNGFDLTLRKSKSFWLEKNYIFSITPK